MYIIGMKYGVYILGMKQYVFLLVNVVKSFIFGIIMGRDKLKTTDLNLDHAAGIRKLCDGNLKWFFDTWIRDEIPALEFYKAMRFCEPITPQVEQTIDEAYFEAIASLGLTHDELATIQPFNKVITDVYKKLEYIESDTQTMSPYEAKSFRQSLKLYLTLIDKGIIKFVEKKKSKAFIS